jgi:uncharacterized protein (DUF2147 family)
MHYEHRIDGFIFAIDDIFIVAMSTHTHMIQISAFVLAACSVIGPAEAGAAEADGIVGTWLVEDGTGKIRVFRCGDKYCGKTVWIKPSKESRNPENLLDVHNPDPSKRTQKIIGKTMMWGLSYDPDDREWEDGFIYDSRGGDVYRCEITMERPDQIRLRGYIGIALIGKTTVWTRIGK